MTKQLKIVYRDYGIADKFSDGTIEMNKNLNKYPQLKKSILKHELEHSDDEGFTKYDFYHDLSATKDIDKLALLHFITRHPKSLVQFLPLYYSKRRGWIFDMNMTLIYLVMFVLMGGAALLAFKL